MEYYSTIKARLIYIFTIPDEAHRGCVKIGETTLDEAPPGAMLAPNSSELNAAARKRIEQYTKTAGIAYNLKHTELTVGIHGGFITSFNDKKVHDILLRSGIKRRDFGHNKGSEWFECSVETALAAIKAAKENRNSINANEIVQIEEEIEFRPEQSEAINKTVKKFRNGGKSMLWNAKMRFGKTLSALQVVKEMHFHRTIIVTHRPVVDEGWFKDFFKIFKWNDPYRYGSREKGEKFENLERAAKRDPNEHYVYFASLQDLRGAQEVGGKYNKNRNILAADYDLLIVDEAHEGTQTELGQNVLKKLQKEKTCVLNLSGTPFNLLDDFKEDEIYTWDYTMEQRAKQEWDLNHFGDPNPYAGLPRLNIYTFDLGKALAGFEDIEDYAFNFKEFFRTWTGDVERDHHEMPKGAEGKFIHEDNVKNFLDLIVKYDEGSNYPFSKLEFRNSFKHTLWMVPGVKEARALSELLKAHPIFGQFDIVNVAGEGDDDVPNDDALKMVNKAMGENPEDTRTITLSCGKLTTGVTVRPWTAVMMLAGSHNTDIKAYMQTIFRVQSPYTTIDGRRKENCYVFDFAPDRTLKVLAEAAKVQTKKTTSESDRIKLGEFLNFCPVIGFNGTKMESYDVDRMLEQLKRAYITRVTRNGCDDSRFYNQEMLLKLDSVALEKFAGLHKIIGSTKANHTSTDVDMAKTGLTNEQYEEVERIKKKNKRELTEEDKKKLEEAKQKKSNAEAAISILRGISIRLPLLMYGAKLDNEGEDITLENFASLIDDQSWEEFMPRGVTKELFAEFAPYYDPDMFRAVSRNYRDLVRAADQLAPMERTRSIARIFTYFRNPDKETVLTPWPVVNMHIGDCIGGQVFYEEDMKTEALEPRFVDHSEVTAKVFKDPNTRILEINSKTGLYPLYMTFSVFAEKLQAYRDSHMLATDVPMETQNQIWDEVLLNNIFVICKTEMAKSITKRTLRGFRQAKVNARYFEDLINTITNQPDLFINKVGNGKKYWNNNTLENIMKFNAIVGNPPYQDIDGGGGSSSTPLYNRFVDIAKLIEPRYISFIIPSRWMTGGRFLDKFRSDMLKDKHITKLFDYYNSEICFKDVSIEGGICYFLRDNDKTQPCEIRTQWGNGYVDHSKRYLQEEDYDIFIRDKNAISILKKVVKNGEFQPFRNHVHPRNYYGLDEFPKSATDTKDKISILGLKNRIRMWKYIPSFKSTKKEYSEDMLLKWKVFASKADGAAGQLCSPVPARIMGAGVLGEPNSICTITFLAIGPYDSESEANNVISYMSTKFFRFLVGIRKNKNMYYDNFMFVPVVDFSKVWTDSELYRKYDLSNDEIEYIESMIKPIEASVLFDPNELVDPNFGEFNLEECGVKVGDKIVYTPTKQELVVAENNMVELDGDKYTLAQFTAKYMPRNKRSVSGFCQGPKYFSFNGMTLYKMKEAFKK